MKSKVIVITGASGGIGAELARQLARRGERLVLPAAVPLRPDHAGDAVLRERGRRSEPREEEEKDGSGHR